MTPYEKLFLVAFLAFAAFVIAAIVIEANNPMPKDGDRQ
jgi:hypothetical protein